MEGLIVAAAVVVVVVGSLSVVVAVQRRKERVLRAGVAEADPTATVVVGPLTAEGASTLDALGHRLGVMHALGGAMVAVAAGADGVGVWRWHGGRAEPLLRLPWTRTRIEAVRSFQGVVKVPAVGLCPAPVAGPRISLQLFRGWRYWPNRTAVAAAVAELEAARPAHGRPEAPPPPQAAPASPAPPPPPQPRTSPPPPSPTRGRST